MKVGAEGMAMSMRRRAFDLDNVYHRPIACEKCGGIMVFKGVGEYHCEKCKFVAFDDYGKARLYIEKHPGANAGEIELKTGVTQKAIRQMLKEKRFEISSDSVVFMSCEMCGEKIRNGTLCAKCEKEYHERIEAEARSQKKQMGYGMQKLADDGAKRYNR